MIILRKAATNRINAEYAVLNRIRGSQDEASRDESHFCSVARQVNNIPRFGTGRSGKFPTCWAQVN